MPKTYHDSETLARGQQIVTACAFIHHSFDGMTKVFLPRRSMNKKFLPGVYELPGGHIDFGEDIIVGLKREIREEFGMDICVGDPFYVFSYINDIKKSHSIEVIYLATFTSALNKIKIDPADHSEYGWFGEDELIKVASKNKNADDPEIKAITKGFSLLREGTLDTGN